MVRFIFILITAMLFISCDSDSGNGNSLETDLILDLSSESMGFVLDSDTLVVSWQASDTLLFERTGSGGIDSLLINWRESGTSAWVDWGTLSLSGFPSLVKLSLGADLTIDLQLILVLKDGSRMIADTTCEALNHHEFFETSVSSSSVIESSSSSGHSVVLESIHWIGDYPNDDGVYELDLKEDKTFSEIFNGDHELNCIEYTGIWNQTASDTLSLSRTSKMTGSKLNGNCTSWATSSPVDTTVFYPVEFMTATGSNAYVSVSGLGNMILHQVQD